MKYKLIYFSPAREAWIDADYRQRTYECQVAATMEGLKRHHINGFAYKVVCLTAS